MKIYDMLTYLILSAITLKNLNLKPHLYMSNKKQIVLRVKQNVIV
jgi:hypothetical protein